MNRIPYLPAYGNNVYRLIRLYNVIKNSQVANPEFPRCPHIWPKRLPIPRLHVRLMGQLPLDCLQNQTAFGGVKGAQMIDGIR